MDTVLETGTGLDRLELELLKREDGIKTTNKVCKWGTIGAMIGEGLFPGLPFEMLAAGFFTSWVLTSLSKHRLVKLRGQLEYTRDGRVWCPDCKRAMEDCKHGQSMRDILVHLRR